MYLNDVRMQNGATKYDIEYDIEYIKYRFFQKISNIMQIF